MNHSPGSRLGQHFLINKEKLRKIAAYLEIEKGDVVVEIGPGHGELTRYLIDYGVKIIAIEKDKELTEFLKKKFANEKNVEIINGDALKILPELPKTYNSSSPKLREPNGLQSITYKIVGNIPYYITGKLLRIIGELEAKPKVAVLTVQKEMAERIAAKPPKMNLLAASVQIWAEPEIVGFVPKKDFQPPPKVDSAIIKLEVRKENLESKSNYYKLIKVLFKQPRKTILNNLSALKPKKEFLPILEKLGINPGDRPQNLDLEKIKGLSETIIN